MFESTRDYTSFTFNCFTSLHCVGFSSSRLSICEDCTIVAFQDTLDNRQSCLLKDILLVTLLSKSHVKAEYSFFFALILQVKYSNLTALLIYDDDIFIVFLLLSFRHWTASNCHLDCFVFICHFNIFLFFQIQSDFLTIFNITLFILKSMLFILSYFLTIYFLFAFCCSY
jgi:hypothetical protein